MSTKEPIFEPSIERIKERLRQDRETFDQLKIHQRRWFILRLVMGYAAVIMLVAILAISAMVFLNAASFPSAIVASAGAAFFVDALGLVISIWKIVFNPDFIIKLAPVTSLGRDEDDLLAASLAAPSVEGEELVILSARYGANSSWMDVAPMLRTRIRGSKLQIRVTNDDLGGDPAHGVVKKLEVAYSYRGVTYSKSVPESEELFIPGA